MIVIVRIQHMLTIDLINLYGSQHSLDSLYPKKYQHYENSISLTILVIAAVDCQREKYKIIFLNDTIKD